MAKDEPSILISRKRRTTFKTEASSLDDKGGPNVHSSKKRKTLKNEPIMLDQVKPEILGKRKRKVFSNETLNDKESRHIQSKKQKMSSPRMGLNDKLTTRTKIGIRRMGALDVKPFQSVCWERYSNEDADVKAAMLCSEWEGHLRNRSWHPFKVVMVGNKEVEMLREDDEKKVFLKEQWGEVIYKTVTNALLELNEYNSSGWYVVPELWNFKEDKKASLKEVIDYLRQKLRTSRRKRT